MATQQNVGSARAVGLAAAMGNVRITQENEQFGRGHSATCKFRASSWGVSVAAGRIQQLVASLDEIQKVRVATGSVDMEKFEATVGELAEQYQVLLGCGIAGLAGLPEFYIRNGPGPAMARMRLLFTPTDGCA